MHYHVTSCVICISNNVECLKKDGSYKSDLCNAIKKTFGKISLHA